MNAGARSGLYMALVVVACLGVMLVAQWMDVSLQLVSVICFAFMMGVALGLGVAPAPDAKTPTLVADD